MGNRMDRLPRQNDGGNHTKSQRESTQSRQHCANTGIVENVHLKNRKSFF